MNSLFGRTVSGEEKQFYNVDIQDVLNMDNATASAHIYTDGCFAKFESVNATKEH